MISSYGIFSFYVLICYRKHILYQKRGAGVKTHALVSMGAALVMLTSEYMRVSLHNTGDMARMGAQIISGIGFLGAGTIIVTEKNNPDGKEQGND